MAKIKMGSKEVPKRAKKAGAQIEKSPLLEVNSILKRFPIVGLGASAGGLEALEKFISNIPAESGMAFVAVTHQHPGHVSLLPELLQKHTDMSVRAATNGCTIEPNCIYLSTADGYLSLLNGRLQMEKPKSPASLHLPIDHFFRSLADAWGRKAIGVVLSGTGSDGTLGLKAIKDAGGTTIAQEPESAKFAGMPSSAVESGIVDQILSAEQMPQQLLRAARGHFSSFPAPEATDDLELSEPLQKIVLLLRTRTRNDFSTYKASTIRRRIERRINLHQLRGAPQYLQYLRDDARELDTLFQELLIGVTQFFRDKEAFNVLAKTAIPELLSSGRSHSTIRVWVPGCASGQEAYSLAILLHESMEQLRKNFTLQIFGSDLDSHAIGIARAACYPKAIEREMSSQRLTRYFIKEGDGYRIKKEIRECVIFAPQNVLKDPPFTKLDIISCRNLLIYFKPEAQRRTLELFSYALQPGGILFLGSSESLSQLDEHFTAENKKWKVFVRKNTPRAHVPTTPAVLLAPADKRPDLKSSAAGSGGNGQLSTTIEKMLLKTFAPTSVIVNEKGDIAYIHGRTGNFLEVTSGQPRLNLLEMAREGLRIPLGSALRQAIAQDGPVVAEGVRVKADDNFAAVTLGGY